MAFQANAFQNDAFQVEETTTETQAYFYQYQRTGDRYFPRYSLVKVKVKNAAN